MATNTWEKTKGSNVSHYTALSSVYQTVLMIWPYTTDILNGLQNTEIMHILTNYETIWNSFPDYINDSELTTDIFKRYLNPFIAMKKIVPTPGVFWSKSNFFQLYTPETKYSCHQVPI